MRRIVVGVVAAAVSASAAGPALAANQTVGVRDVFFEPPRVAVKPGESVTWNNPGSPGTNAPHNVRFEDGSFTSHPPATFGPWTATRTFTTDGVFRYFCEVHVGQGMSGVVYVNAAGIPPPLAALTVSPHPAQVGQAVSFNGAGSSASQGSIVKHEWDLDGNGSFETDTGATATASRSYPAAQTLTTKLRVTDNRGATDETTRPLRIHAAPSASFTVSPNAASTGQVVSFNGGASSDPDGSISKYEWDLDGNGSFETDTFTTPTTSRSYSSPGALTVRLRVTDGDGATGETTRSLQLNHYPLPPPLTPVQPPLQPPLTPLQPRPRPGKCSKLKGKRRAACIRKRCRKLKGAKRRACVKKVTRKR